MTLRLTTLLAFTALSAMSLPAFAQDAAATPAAPRAYKPVTNDMILNPPPEEWISWRRTVDNQGYSPLDLINKDTVKNLELA